MLKIYRPVKTNRITQMFGENNVCTQLMESGRPYVPYRTVNKPVTGRCPTGYGSLYESLGVAGHTGTDFKAKNREPIYFNVDAGDIEWEVLKTNSVSGGYGILIRSRTPVPFTEAPKAQGASMDLIGRQYQQLGGAVHLMFYYGHMAEASHLKDRQIIKTGDKIGLAGTTGASTGVHVHHDFRVCGTNDGGPFFYLDGDGDFKGRLPIKDFYVNRFVLERNTDPDTTLEVRKLQLLLIQLAKEVIALQRRLIALKKAPK